MLWDYSINIQKYVSYFKNVWLSNYKYYNMLFAYMTACMCHIHCSTLNYYIYQPVEIVQWVKEPLLRLKT